MTNKERLSKRIERQNYWNNVMANIAEIQDWCDEALAYTPSCLQKTKKTKGEKKEDINEFLDNAKDTAKDVMESFVSTVTEILNDINGLKEEKDDNVVDIDPKDVTEVAVVEEELKEKNATEERKQEQSKEEVVAAAVVEEKPVESTPVAKKKEDEIVDLEFTVREPGVELPISHDPADDMLKTLPNGDVIDTAFTVRDDNKEEAKKESTEPEVYEFDPVRAQTELMAINKLEQARLSFDHFSKWVNHSQCIDILRDATRNLIVAWASSQGYAMFDTTAPIIGPEMAPYRERLEFLLSRRVINNEEFALLERRASHVMRWDYYSMLEEHKLVESMFTKYFRSVYPWCVDGEKFEQARAKASEENLAYLNSLRR